MGDSDHYEKLVIDTMLVFYNEMFRTAHYAKRLLETIFVHRFSNATMPIMNLFKGRSSIY